MSKNEDLSIDFEGRFNAYLECYENLNIDSLSDSLSDLIHPDIEFKDPFNHVGSARAVVNIFEHMYQQVYLPKFNVIHSYYDHPAGMVLWEFHYSLSPKSERKLIVGTSVIKLNSEGKIVQHIDYWDPAESIYESVPVIGSLIRFVKKKLRAPSLRA